MVQKITISDSIRKVGLRATPARVAVINIMENTSKPLDINELIQLLKQQNVDSDQATIYRIIENFYKKGVISRLQFQKNKFYYEMSREEHHHVICTNCSAIEDISNCAIDSVEKQIEKTKGFKVSSHSLEFFGLCKNCK